MTGGSRGLGRATAAALVAAGASVVITARASDDLEETAAELGVVALPGDLTEPDDIARIAEACGEIDILVNNAAAKATYTSVLDSDDAQWDEHLGVSLLAPLRLVRALGPGMVARGKGVIITLTSTVAVVPVPLIGAYAVSKRAAEWLSQLIAMELGPAGVRALCVAPGLTGTAVVAHLAEDGQLGNWTDATPAGRIATPDEIAALIVWLASDACSYLTGTTVVADGGNTAGQFHLLARMRGTTLT